VHDSAAEVLAAANVTSLPSLVLYQVRRLVAVT
jgi:hypothetical protein